jgi:hypothetical protein
MPPKRKRTTINNIPENVLEQIHGYLATRTPRNSAAFETAFKRAHRAVPQARPNRITNGPKKLEYPEDYPLPGPAEVRELKQRLLFITKLLRALQTDVKNAGYETRLERYTAFKNTLQHILETNRSFDTITRRHMRTMYTLNDGDLINSLREYINGEDVVGEEIQLDIDSSSNVFPFTVRLVIDDRHSSTLSFTEATIAICVGKWMWYILGHRSSRTGMSVIPTRIKLPMSVRRIRVNTQQGILDTMNNFRIRHQADTVDLVRLIELVKRTDPGARWGVRLSMLRDNPGFYHIIKTYAHQDHPIPINMVLQQHGHYGRPYNSNSNNNSRR